MACLLAVAWEQLVDPGPFCAAAPGLCCGMRGMNAGSQSHRHMQRAHVHGKAASAKRAPADPFRRRQGAQGSLQTPCC